jgi:hypothetical protein
MFVSMTTLISILEVTYFNLLIKNLNMVMEVSDLGKFLTSFDSVDLIYIKKYMKQILTKMKKCPDP